ncbi:hypothetical protein HPB48_021670 [Haemaphysalis longicornis]|uniref:F-box/LRR-repeat protein 15-like leucin rich repeat domain-containing protein n=1 Tax=Haemaphysalis longicornis TaxID=44386 RepID=A0A9J6GDH7_HAELO|nr:hypothetical protein HPB48_021670 [Haemaphysalis longicornis]
MEIHRFPIHVGRHPAGRNIEPPRATSQPSSQPIEDAASQELMRLILKRLDQTGRGRMAQLSSSWNAVAEESWMWAGDEARVRLPENSGPGLNCIRRRGIRKVKVLSLGGRPSEQLRGLLQALPDLQSLDLSPCGAHLDNQLVLQSLRLDSLKTLTIQECWDLTDEAIHQIIHHLPNLEEVFFGGCVQLSDDTIKALATGLRKLQKLGMSSTLVSSAGLQRLSHVDSPVATSLTFLDFTGCTRVGDQGVTTLAASMCHLVTLKLSVCHISDAGVVALSHLPSLKVLYLGSCQNLTNESIRALAARQLSLEELDISCCKNIDDEGALKVSTGLGLLELTSLSFLTSHHGQRAGFTGKDTGPVDETGHSILSPNHEPRLLPVGRPPP